VGDLLVDRELEIPKRRAAQSVHVEQEVVEVEALRAVGRPRNPAGKRSMPVNRLGVVLVLRSVELTSGQAH
jgi:hypothetical protein